MRPGRFLRALSAGVFAVVCVTLAATGHVLMSGQGVPVWALCCAFAGTATAAWALAGRERGLLAVTSATVAAQAVLHSGFSLAQALAAPAPAMGGGSESCPADTGMHVPAGGMPGMDMSGAAGGTAPPAAHATHAAHDMAAMGGGMSSFGMLAAHLLAALVCGLWLAYGERALFRVLRAVAARLRTPLTLLLLHFVPARRPCPRRPVPHPARRLRHLLLGDAITTRGPPFRAAVV